MKFVNAAHGGILAKLRRLMYPTLTDHTTFGGFQFAENFAAQTDNWSL